MKCLVLVYALIGCNNVGGVGSYGAQSYANSYYPQTYYQPTYYQQKVYVPYVEKVKFIAVEQPANYAYATVAAGPLRSEERYMEYRAQQPQQTYVYTQPAPQQQAVYTEQPAPSKVAPTPQQEVYPQQASPAKATPQQPVYSQPAPPEKSYPSGQGSYSQQVPPAIPEKGYPSSQQESYSLGQPPSGPGKGYPSTQGYGGGGDSGDVPPPPPISDHSAIYGSMQVSQESSFIPPIPATRATYAPPPASAPELPRRQTFAFDPLFVRSLNNNCSSCHTGSRSKGGFVIFDSPGQLAQLDKEQLGQIYDQVSLGQNSPGQGMPQKRRMSGAAAAVILNGIRPLISPGSKLVSR